jgi:hypothetical protein
MKFSNYQLSLLTLWAFVEAGLGGFLHAFHLPFTGLVLGGFAVVIISLLAQSTKNSFAIILQAMLIVIAIKAFANPATSPFAYIAVAFQGVIGAIVYRLFSINLFTHLLFAILAMVESAVQKLLIVTLFFGKTFWQGIDAMGQSILKQFNFNQQLPFAQTIIFGYITLFVLWAIVLGFWMNALPIQIEARKHLYQNLQTVAVKLQPALNSNKKYYLFIILLICIIVSFFITSATPLQSAINYLMRTLSVLLIWQLLVIPIWAKWLLSKQSKWSQNNNFHKVQQQLPSIANLVKPLYHQVSSQYTGFKKWKEFLLGLIVCSTR